MIFSIFIEINKKIQIFVTQNSRNYLRKLNGIKLGSCGLKAKLNCSFRTKINYLIRLKRFTHFWKINT